MNDNWKHIPTERVLNVLKWLWLRGPSEDPIYKKLYRNCVTVLELHKL